MSFRNYAEYKASGFGWTAALPSHWDSTSLKWLCDRYSGGTPDKNKFEFWEGGTIPWLNSGAVNEGRIYNASAYITQEAFENSSAKWIPPGALVMALAGQGKTKGMVAQLMFASTCNQSMAALVPSERINARFLYWWLVCNYQNIRNMAGGDLRDGLNLDLLGRIPCPLPPLAEQTTIAAFLDCESAKIDKLIAEQETLIVLLAEKRQATISHAVTKGLNPNAEMEDSSAAWLGEVPAHWGVTRLKYAADAIVDCPHETPVYDEAGSYRVIRTADVSEGKLNLDRMYSVTKQEYLLRIRRMSLEQSDIVYGREGERWGFAAQVPVSDTFCLGQRMMQFRAADGIHPRFLMWQLNAQSTYRQGQMDTVGATSPHVNVGTIRNYVLTHPPIAEQETISEFLDLETSKLDKLDAEAAQTISLLKERRSALIAAAVTGQIDVRVTIPIAVAKSPEAIAA